jgi:hypothetical protein
LRLGNDPREHLAEDWLCFFGQNVLPKPATEEVVFLKGGDGDTKLRSAERTFEAITKLRTTTMQQGRQ